jgi:outer membrane protein assembly factor BamB
VIRHAARLMLCAVALALALFAARLPAEEPAGHWPQWRGPNRDNRSADTGLLKSWPEGGPPLKWSVEGLGEGIASVSVAEGQIHTVGQIEEKEYVTALDEGTGMRIWAAPIGPTIGAVEDNRLMRWLSQRTPTVDEDRLYVVRADAQLVCLASEDGRELWRKDFVREFGTGNWTWGFCDRPLVDGARLVCTPGGSEATIVALDKLTGEIVWKSLIGDRELGAYGAMVIADVDGIRQYVTFLDRGLIGVAAEDGRLLWRYDRIKYDIASYTPIVLDDHVLAPYGRVGGLVRLRLERQDEGVDAQEVYFRRHNFDTFQDSTVMADGRLFCCLGRGVLTCIDGSSGETAWQSRKTGNGLAAITFAEDRLYVRHSDGTVTLVEANAADCVVKGAFPIPDHVESIGSTFPVVTGGRLYLRDDNRLFCYDVREGAPQRAAPARIVLATPAGASEPSDGSGRAPKPIFVPTPEDVVAQMLELANVQKDNRVVDLGSGDGRIVIAAAKRYGCTAMGYEIDEELVQLSRERIAEQELGELVTIQQQDMYTADLGNADVVTVYVYSSALEKMKPLFAKLKPGARIVSHFFEIPGLKPERIVDVESQETGNTHQILLYTVPLVESE